MAKEFSIDNSDERLFGIASSLYDEEDYFGALKMLNNSARLWGMRRDKHDLYAKIYSKLGVTERALNAWVMYLDELYESGTAEDSDFVYAYENLIVHHIFTSTFEPLIKYTEEIMRREGDRPRDQNLELFREMFNDGTVTEIGLSGPQEAESGSHACLTEGLKLLRDGQYAAAIKKLKSVREDSDDYGAARELISSAYLMDENYKQAERYSRQILSADPGNVNALTTISVALKEQGKTGEATEYVKKALSLDLDSSNEIYKVATTCCECGMHLEAYEEFRRLEDDSRFDLNMLFFKAMAANNCGKQDEALKSLDDFMAIAPESRIARDVSKEIRDDLRNERLTVRSYYYRREDGTMGNLVMEAMKFRVMAMKGKTEGFDMGELRETLESILDENSMRGDGLPVKLVAECCVYAGFDDMLRRILLNVFYDDDVKQSAVSLIAESNKDTVVRYTYGHTYMRMHLCHVKIGRTMRKAFLSAYTELVCEFCMPEPEQASAVALGCEKLYRRIRDKDMFDLAQDADSTLQAAMYTMAGMDASRFDGGDVCWYFDANKRIYDLMMSDE